MGKDNDEAAGGFGSVFRDRLTYLMNDNNVYGKPVNTQELADEIDISRPAVRKYLKPNDRREVTVPSALVVSRIARYFRTTPNFLLGFDEAADDADAQRAGGHRRAAPPACAGRHGPEGRRPAAPARQAHLQLRARGGQAAVIRHDRHPRTEKNSVRGCLHTIFSKNI